MEHSHRMRDARPGASLGLLGGRAGVACRRRPCPHRRENGAPAALRAAPFSDCNSPSRWRRSWARRRRARGWPALCCVRARRSEKMRRPRKRTVPCAQRRDALCKTPTSTPVSSPRAPLHTNTHTPFTGRGPRARGRERRARPFPSSLFHPSLSSLLPARRRGRRRHHVPRAPAPGAARTRPLPAPRPRPPAPLQTRRSGPGRHPGGRARDVGLGGDDAWCV